MRESEYANWLSSRGIRKAVHDNCYLSFGDHEDLKAMTFCTEDEMFCADYYSCNFVVPVEWLRRIVKEMFDVDDLDYWLQNEYTSDESIEIFSQAIVDRQVVLVDFDY